MEWLETFKRQNAIALSLAIASAIGGLGLLVYSLSGTKYNVIEFCFRPKVINNPQKNYCTSNKRYIIPEGYWRQKDYVPANPRFQPSGTFVLSEKATKLRVIPATNPDATNWVSLSVLLLAGGTWLASKRLQRYKREFVAYYEKLKTDLSQEVVIQEQQRDVVAHKTAVETAYIKDRINDADEEARLHDKSVGQLEFERDQAIKQNELIELNRQLEIAQINAAIAKLNAESAKYNSEANRHTTNTQLVEVVDKIDYKSLCPGKVGDVEFYDWRDLADDAVGIIIAGNSGSGKTSVATWIAGWLTKDEPAQVLALDPHANVNVLWDELGIETISEFDLIEKQLGLLLNLLDERRGLSKHQLDLQPSVIVFADEINACLDNFEEKENMEVAIKRLGSEARKYKIALIALNQSSNADDMGISAQMRNNYLLIGLNATARQIAGTWKKDDPRRKHVDETAYSCVVRGAVPEQVAIHPTHHKYKQFKKKGNKPQGLLPINQLPLTIPLASNNANSPDVDWYEEFIKYQGELGRTPNTEEIKAKWEEMRGNPCTSRQAELIHEHLLNLS